MPDASTYNVSTKSEYQQPHPSQQQPAADGANGRSSTGPADGSPLSGMMAVSAKLPSSAAGVSTQHPHLFHLARFAPNSFDGGSLTGATAENFKILTGQAASVYMARLEPGAVREPHWHPMAWEVNFVISGRVKWAVLGSRGSHDVFEASTGDLVFVPPGHFHYFENPSEDEDLVVLIVFNTSASEPDDDIGIVASLSVIPPDVLGAVFKTSPDVFRNIPNKLETITIVRKQRQ